MESSHHGLTIHVHRVSRQRVSASARPPCAGRDVEHRATAGAAETSHTASRAAGHLCALMCFVTCTSRRVVKCCVRSSRSPTVPSMPLAAQLLQHRTKPAEPRSVGKLSTRTMQYQRRQPRLFALHGVRGTRNQRACRRTARLQLAASAKAVLRPASHEFPFPPSKRTGARIAQYRAQAGAPRVATLGRDGSRHDVVRSRQGSNNVRNREVVRPAREPL